MCGILENLNVSDTRSLFNLIKHRGPDAAEEKRFQVNSRVIPLLHQSLSIVDLSEIGTLPTFTHDQPGCIIFNGKISDHEILKKDWENFFSKGILMHLGFQSPGKLLGLKYAGGLKNIIRQRKIL